MAPISTTSRFPVVSSTLSNASALSSPSPMSVPPSWAIDITPTISGHIHGSSISLPTTAIANDPCSTADADATLRIHTGKTIVLVLVMSVLFPAFCIALWRRLRMPFSTDEDKRGPGSLGGSGDGEHAPFYILSFPIYIGWLVQSLKRRTFCSRTYTAKYPKRRYELSQCSQTGLAQPG
ncbi:hypothetical protein C8Q78DRAFT_1055430 [Trametes maxima]|nr:hypothetical protein C8Q78DRAFT_1055430 [Trametes maxima]